MTSAPSNILAVRSLLLTHLGSHGLSGAEVGIVGDSAHRGGYHCGSDRMVRNDYSVVESQRDGRGLSIYASALDVGTFAYGRHNLRTFSVWLVGECARNAPDTNDIREIIYSPDGRTVKRWDALGRRSGGDSSHLYHTHISFFRDARGDLASLFRRYLTHIGLIKAPAPVKPQPAPTSPRESSMELSDRIKGTSRAADTVEDVLADTKNLRDWLVTPVGEYDGPFTPAPGSPLDLIVKALKSE